MQKNVLILGVLIISGKFRTVVLTYSFRKKIKAQSDN